MKNYFKKFSIMFVMLLAVMLGNLTNALAAEGNQSIKINNTNLSFNKIIYVDGTSGSDTTGEGSQYKPFNTLSKATSAVNTDNTLIYILTSGTYAAPNGLQGLLSSNYTLTFATQSDNLGKVTVDLQTTSSNWGIQMNKLNKFIGINFIRTKAGDSRVYEYFCNSAVENIEFNNCVFVKSNYLAQDYAIILNGNDPTGCKVTKLNFNNCSISNNIGWQYTDISKNSHQFNRSVFSNCAFVNDKAIDYQPNLNGAKFDSNYNITSGDWKNKGTGTNPDGTQANFGVYGGEFAWAYNTTTSSAVVLNIEPEKSNIHLKETISASLTIDNIKEIAAEDVRIKYDSTRLKFLGMDEVDGMKLVKSEDKDGELRLIIASKGVTNIVNAKKVLLKLNFQGIVVGDALVDVTKGKVSDGITMEKDLTDAECGQAIIKIEDVLLQDVNNSGEFTLLDLAIDARHLGENPGALPQYNTDQVINGAIDDNDLLKIGEYMLANTNYKFN